jgi:hypothetical protein
MADKPFLFADFIEEFKVYFTVYDEVIPGYYDEEGKWIDGSETVDDTIIYKGDFTLGDTDGSTTSGDGLSDSDGETEREMVGIILPLSNDELQREANGTYTRHDRKIYTTEPLAIGQSIKYKEQRYLIDSNKPYDDYADVYIYFAKGVGR